MKNRTYLIMILWQGLICFALPIAAQNTLQQEKDSLRLLIDRSEGEIKLKAYIQLCYRYMAEVADDQKMDTLLTLFKQAKAEAIRQGNISTQGVIYGNTIISYTNRDDWDEVIEKAPAYLDFYVQHGLWKYYYMIHMHFINTYNLKGDYEQAAIEADKMYQRAREQNDKGGMANALYATANIYSFQNRVKEQEQCLRECIGILWETSGYDNILTQAYAFLCMSLQRQERYDEVLQLIPEFEKAVGRYEKTTNKIQPEARSNLYTALMKNYIETKEYDKAEIYLAKKDSLAYGNVTQYETLRAKARISQGRGDYRKALAAIDSAIEVIKNSAFDINEARKVKMGILVRMGRSDDALGLFDSILAADDSIKNVEVNAQFDELRTQYEVEKHIAAKERNRHYFFFALGACLFLLLLLAGVFYYNRVIALKNRKLYEQIKKQDRLTDELSQSLPHGISTSQEVSFETSCTTGSTAEHHKLVTRLREYLLSNDNLLNSDINRNEIITALATNKNILTEAVNAVEGKSPMEYIRFLKIEKARKMLDHYPETTIETIAFNCGFNTPSTFYRLFRKQYGFSPAEYRKMSKASN